VHVTISMSAWRRIAAFATRTWTVITPFLTIGSVVFIAILIFALWLFLPSKLTYGRIYVDSPEIYTRERLVNDRFMQDAWLTQQLKLSDFEHAAAMISTAESRRFNANAGTSTSSIGGGDLRSEKTESIATRKKQDSLPVNQRDGVPSERDKLISRADFRDQVRSLIIENQLDDRHDLNASSLYRFKFDATVVPGSNTQALAQVRVSLQGPDVDYDDFDAVDRTSKVPTALVELGSKASVIRWREIYMGWIESLSFRLNQTHKELKQTFIGNEFSHTDYARFLQFVGDTLTLELKSTPGCGTQFTVMQMPRERTRELAAEDHAARKRCFNELVQKWAITEHSLAPPRFEQQQAEYYIKTPNVRSYEDVNAQMNPTLVAQKSEYLLNAYFASKAVQLVLGISLPLSSFVDKRFHRIKALEELIELAFFNPQPSESDGTVFLVEQRILAVAGINPTVVTPEKFALYKSTDPALVNNNYADLVAVDFADPSEFKVFRSDMQVLRNIDYPLTRDDFVESNVGKGAYVAQVELGLRNFAKKARLHSTAFSYAITPKENADFVSATIDVKADLGSNTPTESSEQSDFQFIAKKSALARALNRRATVVGFSEFNQDERIAAFGWVIGPREVETNGTEIIFRHSASQYSLSALVSIPSWWTNVSVKIETSWIAEDGDSIPTGAPPIEYRVTVPTDYEPLEALILNVTQLGPELMESRLDPIQLSACNPGAIIIPGRRLWRSTVVTVGSQTSDAITVLPNMKGIIARFDVVENQTSPTEERSWPEKAYGAPLEIQRVVRVWTSQGTIVLPQSATIGISNECHNSTRSRAVHDSGVNRQ
jgi:hypothetical protein